MQIINRDKEGAFAELVRKPEDLPRVFIGLQRAIQNSFRQDQARSALTVLVTEREIESRFKICEKWFRIMRGDEGYSIDKTLDFLPIALRCELDKISFQPPKAGESWAPGLLKKDPGMVS